MNTPEGPTREFEERLLAELKCEIEAGGAAASRQPTARPAPARLGWRRRVVLAGGVAAAFAVALGAGLPLLWGGGGTAAAYAVEAQPDGSVTVEIWALRDAEGLERRLRAAGIPAAVQYLPPGKACKELTFTPARAAGVTSGGMAINAEGSVRFTIDASSLAAGQTLVIYTQDRLPVPDSPEGQWATSVAVAVAGPDGQQWATSVAVAVADGEVQPCEVVDAPAGSLAPPVLVPGAGAGAVTESEPATR